MRYPAGDTRQQQKNIPAHVSAHAKEIKNKKDADGEHGALELHGAVGPGEPLLLGRQRLNRILELLFWATFRGMPTANALGVRRRHAPKSRQKKSALYSAF